MTLARSSVVTAILMLQAIAASAQPGAEPVPVNDDLQPPSAVPARTEAPARVHHGVDNANATTRTWAAGARLTGLSGIGALPGVNYGAELATYVRHGEYFGELAFGWWRPEDTKVVATTPERVELGLKLWTLRGGMASMSTPLRGWLLVEAGEIASPKGMPGVMARVVTGDIPDSQRWRAVGAGFGVAWPIADSSRLFGMMELAVPVQRGTVMLQNDQYEPEALAVRSSVGIEVGWR